MRTPYRIAGALWFLLGLATAAAGQTGVRWQSDVDAALKTAAASNRLVLLHFSATWCKPCKMLEHNVFSQDSVAQALETNYVPVKVDVDRSPELAQKYGVQRMPWDVVLSADGQVLRDFNSPQSVQQYLGRMQEIASRYRPAPNMVAANTAPITPTAYGGQPTPPADSPNVAAAAPPATAGRPWSDDRYSNYRNQRQQPVVEPTSPPLANQVGGPAAAPPGQSQFSPPAQTSFGQGQTAGVPTYQPPQLYGPEMNTPPTVAAQQSPAAMQPELSSGAAPAQGSVGIPSSVPPQPTAFGLDGYCPVHLAEQAAWTPGDRRFGAVHRGKTYLFASESCQKKFMADPDRYSPAFSGNDPVLLMDRGQTVAGRRDIGCFFGAEPNRRIVLFADEASYQAFSRNPQRYAAGVFAPQP